MVCYVQPKGPHTILQKISKTTKLINIKFQDSIWTTKMCPAMHYCDVITKPSWRTAAILKIAKSPYLSEKSWDFDKIWYTTADNEPHDSHVTKNWNFWNLRWRRSPSWKSLFWPLPINRLSDISEILHQKAERHADKGHMTKTANFYVNFLKST